MILLSQALFLSMLESAWPSASLNLPVWPVYRSESKTISACRIRSTCTLFDQWRQCTSCQYPSRLFNKNPAEPSNLAAKVCCQCYVFQTQSELLSTSNTVQASQHGHFRQQSSCKLKSACLTGETGQY